MLPIDSSSHSVHFPSQAATSNVQAESSQQTTQVTRTVQEISAAIDIIGRALANAYQQHGLANQDNSHAPTQAELPESSLRVHTTITGRATHATVSFKDGRSGRKFTWSLSGSPDEIKEIALSAVKFEALQRELIATEKLHPDNKREREDSPPHSEPERKRPKWANEPVEPKERLCDEAPAVAIAEGPKEFSKIFYEVDFRLYHGTDKKFKTAIKNDGFDVEKKEKGAIEKVKEYLPFSRMEEKMGERASIFFSEADKHNYATQDKDTGKRYAKYHEEPSLVRLALPEDIEKEEDSFEAGGMLETYRWSAKLPNHFVFPSKQEADSRDLTPLYDLWHERLNDALVEEGYAPVTKSEATDLFKEVQSDSEDDTFSSNSLDTFSESEDDEPQANRK